MPISTLFIDLDGTLYPHENGLWEAIADRMGSYMVNVLKLPADKVPQIRRDYFLRYGTTLRGLIIHHQVDPVEYLAVVHDVPLEKYLSKDARLRSTLESLQQPRWILTNSDKAHSQRVLNILGVEDLFEGIIDVTAVDYRNKPDPEVFKIAIEMAGQPDPEYTLFVDDIPNNLPPAKSLGMHTVLVGNKEPGSGVDLHIRDVYGLPKAVYSLENGGPV